MRKLCRIVVLGLIVAGVLWGRSIVSDRQKLNDELIRLHVIANSDSEEDQNVKLQVRDAVIELLGEKMSQMKDVDQAKEYLQEHLEQIRQTANRVLQESGFSEKAAVSLDNEQYPVREYDTFSLPSGVYESLRIVIGEGNGHNWWCVVFPEFCVPATAGGFEEKSVACGFSDTLTDTLERKDGYEVRFFLLDWLGKVENFFHEK